MLRQLKEKYREVPVASAITERGGFMEVLASKDGRTWSIIVTSPHGMTCLVSAGEGWRTLRNSDKGPGA